MGSNYQLYPDDRNGGHTGGGKICFALVAALDGGVGEVLLYLYGQPGCRAGSAGQVLCERQQHPGPLSAERQIMDGQPDIIRHHSFDGNHVYLQHSFGQNSHPSKFGLFKNQYGFHLFFHDLHGIFGDALCCFGNIFKS